MPGKKAQESKSPAMGVSAPRAKALVVPIETAPIETAPIKTAPVKTKAIRSASKVGSEPKTPAAAKPPKTKTTASTSDSILNLNDAVNGYVSAEQVAERAYFLWLERGCPMGSPEEDWFSAERELGPSH